MGTSQSSPGSPSGVPLVPPWVPDPEASPDNDAINNGHQNTGDSNAQNGNLMQPQPLAERGRFSPARRSLGNFARTGSGSDMRRGVGHYIRKGYGNSRRATQRFSGTARTASSLYDALSAAASGQAAAPDSPLDPALLSGRSADEIMDAVVEAVRPVDGTQDAEASRDAIRNAPSDLLNRFPEAELLNLSASQRAYVIERYTALDVYNRFRLDVGKTLQEKAPSAAAALSRLRDVKDYIVQTVASAVRQTQGGVQPLNARRIASMARQALRETFDVFEGYLE
jgi:hypothetical protein